MRRTSVVVSEPRDGRLLRAVAISFKSLQVEDAVGRGRRMRRRRSDGDGWVL